MRWTQMVYAEVRAGEPHKNGEAWGETEAEQAASAA